MSGPLSKRDTFLSFQPPAVGEEEIEAVAATLRSGWGARVMLCGGAPLDGPRHVWWNFVSSRPDRIRQAREDWDAARFPEVPNDAGERIEIPDVPKTVSYL